MRQMTAGFLASRGLAETRPVADVEAASVAAGNLRPSHYVHLIG
jgi:hypothetical protein